MTMKEATYDDAVQIASQLNLQKDSVWAIIKGRKYNSFAELCLAVHKALSI